MGRGKGTPAHSLRPINISHARLTPYTTERESLPQRYCVRGPLRGVSQRNRARKRRMGNACGASKAPANPLVALACTPARQHQSKRVGCRMDSTHSLVNDETKREGGGAPSAVCAEPGHNRKQGGAGGAPIGSARAWSQLQTEGDEGAPHWQCMSPDTLGGTRTPGNNKAWLRGQSPPQQQLWGAPQPDDGQCVAAAQEQARNRRTLLRRKELWREAAALLARTKTKLSAIQARQPK